MQEEHTDLTIIGTSSRTLLVHKSGLTQTIAKYFVGKC